MKPISLKQFLKLEREHRLAGAWWSARYAVLNDHDVVVEVAIKSHGLYNQRLFLNGDAIDHSLGHTCSKVTELRSKLSDKINSFRKVTDDQDTNQSVEQVSRT